MDIPTKVKKKGNKWTCNCWGLQRLKGYDKKGRPIYKQLECDHIKIAKK